MVQLFRAPLVRITPPAYCIRPAVHELPLPGSVIRDPCPHSVSIHAAMQPCCAPLPARTDTFCTVPGARDTRGSDHPRQERRSVHPPGRPRPGHRLPSCTGNGGETSRSTGQDNPVSLPLRPCPDKHDSHCRQHSSVRSVYIRTVMPAI